MEEYKKKSKRTDLIESFPQILLAYTGICRKNAELLERWKKELKAGMEKWDIGAGGLKADMKIGR
ncbi:MAG TPA: hypothetical protein H9671_07945 [Firmicutes bacterium]|nr:hypothetical protein [Bacillota bacterium]